MPANPLPYPYTFLEVIMTAVAVAAAETAEEVDSATTIEAALGGIFVVHFYFVSIIF